VNLASGSAAFREKLREKLEATGGVACKINVGGANSRKTTATDQVTTLILMVLDSERPLRIRVFSSSGLLECSPQPSPPRFAASLIQFYALPLSVNAAPDEACGIDGWCSWLGVRYWGRGGRCFGCWRGGLATRRRAVR
jgi:hypothetical protein